VLSRAVRRVGCRRQAGSQRRATRWSFGRGPRSGGGRECGQAPGGSRPHPALEVWLLAEQKGRKEEQKRREEAETEVAPAQGAARQAGQALDSVAGARQTLAFPEAGLVPRALCALSPDAPLARFRIRSGDPVIPARALPDFDSRLEERFARDFSRLTDDWEFGGRPARGRGRGVVFAPGARRRSAGPARGDRSSRMTGDGLQSRAFLATLRGRSGTHPASQEGVAPFRTPERFAAIAVRQH
jgi:hypothetical protein